MHGASGSYEKETPHGAIDSSTCTRAGSPERIENKGTLNRELANQKPPTSIGHAPSASSTKSPQERATSRYGTYCSHREMYGVPPPSAVWYPAWGCLEISWVGSNAVMYLKLKHVVCRRWVSRFRGSFMRRGIYCRYHLRMMIGVAVAAS